MNTKKLILGIAGIMVMISPAKAVDVDTDSLRLICERDPGLLWVERTRVCIPIIPCGNPKYEEKYCNRDFKDKTAFLGFEKPIVNLFARLNKLDCKYDHFSRYGPVINDSYAERYAVCRGKDVLVFQVPNKPKSFSYEGVLAVDVIPEICEHVLHGTVSYNDYSYGCKGKQITRQTCDIVKEELGDMLKKQFNISISYTINFDGCWFIENDKTNPFGQTTGSSDLNSNW